MPEDATALDNVLTVEHLRTEFRIDGAWHAAVDDVSFALAPRETLALVGESGCGKSVTALSVMGLVPAPQGRIGNGRIALEGRELVGLSGALAGEAPRRADGDDLPGADDQPEPGDDDRRAGGRGAGGAPAACRGARRMRRRWRCWTR